MKSIYKKGFTLVEIIIAVLILTIVSAAVISGVLFSINSSSKSMHTMKMYSDVRNIVECAKTPDFEESLKRYFGEVSISDTDDGTYAFYIDESKNGAERFFSDTKKPDSYSKILYKIVISIETVNTLDNYEVQRITVTAFEYKYDDSSKLYSPCKVVDGNELSCYEVYTSVVAPISNEAGDNT